MREFVELGLLASFASSLPAQDFRLVAHDRPRAELQHEFTKVSEIFELRDGRVVVIDREMREVRLADLRNRTATVLGRTGDGPREYRAPLELIPLGGDSVGIYDDANVRILVITATGNVGGFATPFSTADGTRIGGLVGDGRGFLYAEQRARSADDSASLFRWRVGVPEAEFVSRIHRPPPAGAVSLGGGMTRPGTFARPSTRNMWTVDNDGTVSIVSFDPYQVTLISSGKHMTGPVIPYLRVPVNDSVKAAYVSDLPKRATGLILDGRSGTQTSVTRSAPPVDPSTMTWAREVPPFKGDAFVVFAPDGKLWIQRTTFGREGARYDVVDRSGKLVDRVRLPEGHRIAGFGRNAMYVVRRDADDLEFLQLRPVPR